MLSYIFIGVTLLITLFLSTAAGSRIARLEEKMKKTEQEFEYEIAVLHRKLGARRRDQDDDQIKVSQPVKQCEI